MNKFLAFSLCVLPMVCQAKDVRLSSNVPAELSQDGKIVGKMPLVVSVDEHSTYELVISGKRYSLDLTTQRGRSGGLTSTTTEETTCAPMSETTSSSVKATFKPTSSTSSDDEEEKEDDTVVSMHYTPTDYYINVSKGKEDLKAKAFILTQYGSLKFGNQDSLKTLSSLTNMPEYKLTELLNQTVSPDEAVNILSK